MSEKSTPPNLFGLDHSESEQNHVYLELAQAILEKERRTTLVQEYMSVDAVDDEQKIDAIGDRNLWAANCLARMQQNFNDNQKYRSLENRTFIFNPEEMQAHYERVSENGLTELSPQQALIALKHLNKDKQSRSVLKEIHKIMQQRIEEALEIGDIATYFLLWSDRRNLSTDVIVGVSEYLNEDESIVSSDQYFEYLEERKEEWEAEAKAYTRLREMVDSLPYDPISPRAAVIRLPAEVNSRRPCRVLIDFPADTFKANGGMYNKADPDRKAFYSGAGAPDCVLHSYDVFYKITRQKNGESDFTPRPFYITAYKAEGSKDLEGFPEEANQILELSFKDSEETIPNARVELSNKFPQIIFTKKQAIDDTDLEQVIIGNDGLAHFIVGTDEAGNTILQDSVVYPIRAVMSGLSNVPNIPVEKL